MLDEDWNAIETDDTTETVRKAIILWSAYLNRQLNGKWQSLHKDYTSTVDATPNPLSKFLVKFPPFSKYTILRSRSIKCICEQQISKNVKHD